MSAPEYGYNQRGRVLRAGPVYGTYIVTVTSMAETYAVGPLPSTVTDLVAGDAVVLTQMGMTRGDLVITGRVVSESAPTDLQTTWLTPYVAAMSAEQPYREPTGAEATDIIKGLRRVAQGASPETLLSAHGYTVTTGVESVSGRAYALAMNESGTDRAWGAYLFDLTEPVRSLIEIPHPKTDENSPQIGLRHWQLVPGSMLLVAGAHRNAAADLADVAHQVNSLFHKVASTWSTYGIPQTQWHGYADATAPAFQVIISSGSSTPGDAIKAAADQTAAAGFAVGRGWDGSADATGLTGLTNSQGDAAHAIGTAFTHVEVNATVRGDVAAREKLIQAVAEADATERSLYGPFLARAVTGQFPQRVGSANTTGSSPYAARADHIHAERIATLDRITALETGSVYSEEQPDLYEDRLASIPPWAVSTFIDLANDTVYIQRLYTRRAMSSVSLARVYNVTAGSGGTATMGLYTGASLSALTLLGSGSVGLTNAGRRAASVGGPHDIPANRHVVVALVGINWSTVPKLACSAVVPHSQLLRNPSTVAVAGRKALTTLPATMDLTDGTWTVESVMRLFTVA